MALFAMTDRSQDRSAFIASTAEELGLLVSAVQAFALVLPPPTGEIRSWNPGAGRIFGYDAADAVGKSFSMFYPPADIQRRKPQRELEVAARDGRLEDEGGRVRKNGDRFWVNTVITTMRKPDGELRGFAKITRDLTEKRTAEEALRH